MYSKHLLSRLKYALAAWSGFLTKELEGRINAFLRRMYNLRNCQIQYNIQNLEEQCDKTLFRRMLSESHCLHQLLPSTKNGQKCLRPRGHNFMLPMCIHEIYKNSFVNRCLYRYV